MTERYMLEYNETQQLFHLNPFNEYTNDWEKPLYSNGWRPINIIADESVNNDFLTFIDKLSGQNHSLEKVGFEVYNYLIRL